jgi:hypothetical protein
VENVRSLQEEASALYDDHPTTHTPTNLLSCRPSLCLRTEEYDTAEKRVILFVGIAIHHDASLIHHIKVVVVNGVKKISLCPSLYGIVVSVNKCFHGSTTSAPSTCDKRTLSTTSTVCKVSRTIIISNHKMPRTW